MGVSNQTDLEEVSCPCCTGSPSSVWMDDNKPTQYRLCQKCKTVYASPRASQESRLLWLNESFALEPALDLVTIRREALKLEAEHLQSFRNTGRILDYGCSTGAFLEYFNAADWERHGVELAPTAAAHAKSKGMNVLTGTLISTAFPKEHFDLVTVIDMFYYLDCPVDELREIHRVLAPSGLLGIEIPGRNHALIRGCGPICWLAEGRWSRISTDSSYLYWYSARGLETLLARCGFKLLTWDVVPSPFERGFVGKLKRLHYFISQKTMRFSRRLADYCPKVLWVFQK